MIYSNVVAGNTVRQIKLQENFSEIPNGSIESEEVRLSEI